MRGLLKLLKGKKTENRFEEGEGGTDWWKRCGSDHGDRIGWRRLRDEMTRMEGVRTGCVVQIELGKSPCHLWIDGWRTRG